MAVDLEMLIKAKAVLGTAQAEISKFLGSVEEQTAKIGSTSAKAGSSIGAYLKGGFLVAGAAATAFVGTVTAIGAAIVALGVKGAGLDDTRSAFAQLTRESGGYAASLATLRKATDGVISNTALMEAVNKSFSLGLRLNQDEMKLTGETARILANRVGTDAKTAFETLTMAMASGKDATLQTIGLNIDAKQAVDDFARSVGKESAELNKNEQILAKKGAILKQLRKELDETGRAEVGFADQIERISNTITNLNDDFAVAIATSPAVNVAMGAIADAFEGAFGDTQVTAVQTITGYINKFAIFLVDVGQIGVSTAKYITFAFQGVKAFLLDAMYGFFQVDAGLAKVIGGLLGLIEKIPGASKVIGGLTQYTKDYAVNAQGMADSLKQQARDAITSAGTMGASFDKFNGVLATTKAKMIEASKTQADSGAIADALAGRQHRNAGAHAALSKAAESVAKKIREVNDAADLAAKNGQLEQWARNNASALLQLGQDAAAAGQKLSGNALTAWTQALAHSGDADLQKYQDKLIADQAESTKKGIDAMNEKFLKSLDIRYTAEKEYSQLSAKRTLSDFEYQKFIIEQEEAEKIRELESTGRATAENLDAIKRVTAEKMAAAADAHNDAIAKMKAATNSWGNLTTKWLSGIPELLKSAFTGGGGISGALKALTAGIGGDIGNKLFSGPNGLGQKVASGLLGSFGPGLASKLGGLVGTIGGPIGSMLGGLAAKGLGKLFGGDKNTKEIKAMSGQLTELYGGIENIRALSKATGVDLEAAFKGKGKGGLEALQKAAEQLKAKLAESQKAFGDWADDAIKTGVRLPQSLVPYLAQLERMGVLTKDHADTLRKLSENGTVDLDAMKAAADRYGISIAALGPAFQQGVANQNWQQVVDDLRLFEQGGADMNAVLHDMREEISKLVQDSIAFGTSIPENMRPWIEKLRESGELVDENGKKIESLDGITFGDPMIAALDRIVERFDLLLEGLGLIPKAIGAIPRNVDIDVHYREHGRPGIVEGEDNPNSGEAPPIDVPGAAAGGLFSSPAFRVVAEREPEIVGSPNVIVQALAEAMRQTGGSGGGAAGNTSVAFNLTTPIGTVDSIRQMFYEELGPVLIDWLNDNRGGARTQVQQALGIA